MNTLIEDFKQAQLAFAAYADLQTGMQNNLYRSKLVDAGMSPSQAQQFATTYTVVATYDAPGNGLQATVFADAAGNKYLAVQGTAGIADLLTDAIDIAWFGSPNAQGQYVSLAGKVLSWMADGTLPQSFTVTGHSLGGFLAGALAVEFPTQIAHAYLYNAPGVGGAAVTVGLQRLFGVNSPPTLNLSNVTNLRADAGISPISSLGQAWGTPVPIVIENQLDPALLLSAPGALNHSQQVLTDALAVYATYAQLDPAATPNLIGGFIKAASAENRKTLELALDALRRPLLGSNITATLIGNRDTLYANLLDPGLKTRLANLAGKVTLTTSVGLTAANGQNVFADFLTLKYLTPFVLAPNSSDALNTLANANPTLYQDWLADAALTPEQKAAGLANYSDLWYADRAATNQRYRSRIVFQPELRHAPCPAALA